jgi:signal transduction histidine kinase
MQESAERMQRVLRGLLDLARPRRSEMQTVAMGPLLDRILLLAGHRLRDAKIRLQKDVDPGIPAVRADECQLEQAVLNLVLNACDSLENRKDGDGAFSPRLVLRAGHADSRVYVEVEDNGAGIDPHNMPHLFDAFFTTKAPGRGTGLGLSIVKAIVQEHAGDITVESQPGEGATFRIRLPAKGIAVAGGCP